LNVCTFACRLVTSNWDIVAFCKNINNISSIVRIVYLEVKLTGCVPWHILLLHTACGIGHSGVKYTAPFLVLYRFRSGTSLWIYWRLRAHKSCGPHSTFAWKGRSPN
jgi:hypothetical protein